MISSLHIPLVLDSIRTVGFFNSFVYSLHMGIDCGNVICCDRSDDPKHLVRGLVGGDSLDLLNGIIYGLTNIE